MLVAVLIQFLESKSGHVSASQNLFLFIYLVFFFAKLVLRKYAKAVRKINLVSQKLYRNAQSYFMPHFRVLKENRDALMDRCPAFTACLSLTKPRTMPEGLNLFHSNDIANKI